MTANSRLSPTKLSPTKLPPTKLPTTNMSLSVALCHLHADDWAMTIRPNPPTVPITPTMRRILNQSRHASRATSRTLALVAGSLTIAALTGCTGGPGPMFNDLTEPEEQFVRIDGNTEDWPGDAVAIADEHHVFFRFSVQGNPYSIQAADKTVAILLDVDADPTTGKKLPGRLSRLGIDMEIQASPTKPEGGTDNGVAVIAVDSSGFKLPLERSDFDVSFAPTYASTWYEARVSRTPDNPATLPIEGLLSTGTLSGVYALLNNEGKIVGVSEPFTIKLGPICRSGKKLTFAVPPKKPEGGVRILSYNVLRSAPNKTPEPFRRLLNVIDPDVILFQEWVDGTPEEISSWLSAVDGGATWQVAKPVGGLDVGGGVIVASKFPLVKRFEKLTSQGKAIRAVGASIDTPLGIMIATSVHLKCCGKSDGPEDQQRITEARAINAAMLNAANTARATVRIIGGDLNLVGTRPPLDIMRKGLDADGTDLAVADAEVLGDSIVETWTENGNTFGPGRLDFISYSDASVRVVNQFVFDTRRISPEALARLGVDALDSAASDHLPVVIDIVER